MADSSTAAPAKKTARTFDFAALMDQARAGAQERSNVDWDSEIEKAKEENESRLAEMKLKANEATKKMQNPTNSGSAAAADDDDDDDFGPSINLASAAPADDNDDDDNDSSDDEEKQQSQVRRSCRSSRDEMIELFQSANYDADRLDDDEQPFLPITHEVDLQHGTKSVSCLTLDTVGERLISGGFDYQMKMWDFPTMDKSLQYHRAISPCESHQLRSIEFSPGNDMLLIASGSCQGKVINRDGKKQVFAEKTMHWIHRLGKNIYECIRGDMYLVDMQKTRGHVSTLNRACWNPKDLNVSESSTDGIRITLDLSLGVYDLFRRWNCSSLVADSSYGTCLLYQDEIWARKESVYHDVYLQYVSHS